jgi:hypothetical protein
MATPAATRWLLQLGILLLGASTAVAGGCRNISVVEKDVIVVGGGASGTYAAVRLREDYNKSIAVIEIKNRLVRCRSDWMV